MTGVAGEQEAEGRVRAKSLEGFLDEQPAHHRPIFVKLCPLGPNEVGQGHQGDRFRRRLDRHLEETLSDVLQAQGKLICQVAPIQVKFS